MPNKLDLKIKFPSDPELKKMFDAVPILMQHNVSDKAVRAASKIVASKAKKLAPRQTAAQRRLRSANQAKKANWNKPLHTTIGLVVRKYAANAAGIVGPKWPDGNKAYFNTSPKGRVRKLWGRDPRPGGLSTIAPQIRNWIVQAFDETKTQQLEAMKKSLKKSMREIWGG